MPSVRSRTVVLTRIQALSKHVKSVEASCDREALKATARELDESLREARAWLDAARSPEPVLVTHVAKMVDATSQRLYALVRQMSSGALLITNAKKRPQVR